MRFLNASQIHFVAYQLFRLYCWMTIWSWLVLDTHPLRIGFSPFHYVPHHKSASDHVGTPVELQRTATETYDRHPESGKKWKRNRQNGTYRQSKWVSNKLTPINKSQHVKRMLIETSLNVLIMLNDVELLLFMLKRFALLLLLLLLFCVCSLYVQWAFVQPINVRQSTNYSSVAAVTAFTYIIIVIVIVIVFHTDTLPYV